MLYKRWTTANESFTTVLTARSSKFLGRLAMASSTFSSSSSAGEKRTWPQRYLIYLHENATTTITKDIWNVLKISFPDVEVKKIDRGFTFFPSRFTRRETVIRVLG